MAQMRLSADLLERDFSTLSGGEKTSILIIALFLRKEYLQNYLVRKKGYIVVSHDTAFLDEVEIIF